MARKIPSQSRLLSRGGEASDSETLSFVSSRDSFSAGFPEADSEKLPAAAAGQTQQEPWPAGVCLSLSLSADDLEWAFDASVDLNVCFERLTGLFHTK